MDPNKPQADQVNSAQAPQAGGGQVPQPTAPSGPTPLAEVPEAPQPAPAPVGPQTQLGQPAGMPQSQTPTPAVQGGTVPQTQEPPKQEGSGQ